MAAQVVQQIDGTPLENAYFLYQHALELNWKYILELQGLCDANYGRVDGLIKSNLARIAQKIRENENNPFRIGDMVRARITVEDPSHLEKTFKAIDNHE
jgi:hypothetical protein